MAATSRVSYLTGADGYGSSYGTNYEAQTFTTVESFSCTSVKILAYRLGSPGNCTVSIRAAASNKPTGSDLVSKVQSANAWTTSSPGDWQEFVFDTPYTLAASTQYAIVVHSAGANSANQVKWSLDATAPGYTGGRECYSTDSGSAWTGENYDELFDVWGTDVTTTVDLTASGGGTGGGTATVTDYAGMTASGGGVGGGSATLAIATTVYLTASGGGVGGGVASLIRIRLTLYSASQNKQCLVAVGNDQVWMEDTSVANGTMVQIAASIGDVDTTDNLSMFAAYGKAVILNGAKLKIADFSNAKITTASIGTNPPDFETVLTGATSGASMAVDYLSSLSGAAIIRGKRTTTALFSSGETVTGIDDDGNAISFVTDSAESDGLKWYNYITFGNSVSFGSLPSKAYIGCLHLGRIFLAGNPDFPNQWYASRQGNMWDWLYNQEDAQSACTGADVEMGAVQDIIRALISYDNDYLLFGCHGSIYALLGDPMQGGSMKRVSDKVGVFESRSWCFDEDRNLYFVGPGGLYRIAKGLTGIENLTQFSLPSLIHEEQVDPSTHRILLAFDTKRHGILVSIVTISTGANSCYWYDIRAGSFMPESYPAQCAAYSMEYYDSVVIDQRELLIGSTDGYIRRFDETKKDDDIGALDSAIDSYVTFGPFPLGETPADDGIVGCVYGVMAGTGSSSVTYYTYVGDSPEDVMNKVTADTYSVSGLVQATGLQRGAKQRRMARGKWGAIRLRNDTAGQTWGMEAIEVDIYPAGRLA